jgi:hypothetical protein
MTYEAEKGDSIYTAAQNAVFLAMEHDKVVYLLFNDIEISVTKSSSPVDICTIYSLKMEIKRLQTR